MREWLTNLRSRGLNELGVLIRPHPQNAQIWDTVDLSEFGNVTIYPRKGANPIMSDAKADFFDSIAHSSRVVGINTSAQIESAVIGKPVLTVEHPLFAETQRGTLHYHLLVKHGLLLTASDFPEHIVSGHLEFTKRIFHGMDTSFLHLSIEQKAHVATLFAGGKHDDIAQAKRAGTRA